MILLADDGIDALAAVRSRQSTKGEVTEEMVERGLEAAKKAFDEGHPADKKGQIRAALEATLRAPAPAQELRDASERTVKAGVDRPADLVANPTGDPSTTLCGLGGDPDKASVTKTSPAPARPTREHIIDLLAKSRGVMPHEYLADAILALWGTK